jgi:hypothetical protein
VRCGGHRPECGVVVTGLSSRRPGFDSRSVNLGFVVDKVALGQVFFPAVLRLSPVRMIPLVLHKDVYRNTAVIRRTRGRSLRIFKQNNVLRILRRTLDREAHLEGFWGGEGVNLKSTRRRKPRSEVIIRWVLKV